MTGSMKTSAEEQQGILNKAFVHASGDTAYETEVFESITAPLLKTKQGREAMDSLTELGYRFRFDADVEAACCPDEKEILMNPFREDSYLAHALMHETRHAVQNATLGNTIAKQSEGKLCVADSIKLVCAMEADAYAHQAAFVSENKDRLPEVYENYKTTGYPMVRVYEAELKKSGDKRKALSAAFESFYDCKPLCRHYQNSEAVRTKMLAREGVREDKTGCFSERFPSEKIATTILLYEGKPYVSADFLDSDKACALTQKEYREIKRAVNNYAAAVSGVKSDTSIDTMAIRDGRGVILKSAKQVKKMPFAALKQREGR